MDLNRFFRYSITLVFITTLWQGAWAECCNRDSPDCACFQNNGSWNPSGPTIQDVALDTLGTIESCVPDDGGKPYYQMVNGIDNRSIAQSAACAGIFPYPRDAWCSETISYWHHKAGIPYSAGYRNSDWALNWQLYNTSLLRTFYETEEDLPGGRGRWIRWQDLDYDDIEMGVTVPLPGSYVLIAKYEQLGDGSWIWNGASHSMLINEMWIHRMISPLGGGPKVTGIEVSLLEGNSGPPGWGKVNDSAVFEDLLSLTPWGNDFIGTSGKKIKGFGVDLDSRGQPIYDASRLHYVSEKVPYDPRLERILEAERARRSLAALPSDFDPLWETYYKPLIPKLVDYAKLARAKGLHVTSPANIHAKGIPDGIGIQWNFPSNLDKPNPQGIEITIDLLKLHPLPIKGLILNWDAKFIPKGYNVQWAGEDKKFASAKVPEINKQSQQAASFPVYVTIFEPKEGAKYVQGNVRYIKFIFPKGTFPTETTLKEVQFIFEWPSSEDAKYNP